MQIRKATAADSDAMRDIFRSVIAPGDALPFWGAFNRETFHAHWLGSQPSYVAETDAGVVGMYKVGANYPGLGSHVASATYAVSPIGEQPLHVIAVELKDSLAPPDSKKDAAKQFIQAEPASQVG